MTEQEIELFRELLDLAEVGSSFKGDYLREKHYDQGTIDSARTFLAAITQPAADNAPQAPSAGSVAVQSFPERNPSLENCEQGVFHKFDIRRVDGSDQRGGKHYGCRYFVLDMTHDAHAPAALLAYADSCSDTHPYLAADLRAEFATRDTATRAQAPDSAADALTSFQDRVQPWMMACFGLEIARDRIERNHRFFEEATEAVQANGMTRSEAHQLVDYTFDRPVGELHQEIGGVMVTLAALCLASGQDMHAAGETELARINRPDMVIRIRAKQAAKPKHSPLPEHVVATSAHATNKDAHD